jgi:S1-C subfamily serine protease
VYAEDYYPRRRSTAAVAAAILAAVALAFAGLALLVQQRLSTEIHGLRADLQRAEKKLAGLDRRNDRLAGAVKQREAGIAPLARRVLKSVFTVETELGLGSGFAAWRRGGATYVLTAAHVLEGTDRRFVTVSRKGGSWSGEIVRVDRRNDLAVVRISGRPKGAEPLWQDARRARPNAGDQLLLLGSPFGLHGTVTTGVVSRVTKKVIQTDAAANPGNSGGPALDRKGRIVGILVSGGGQNVNFAVPIAKACLRLRRC